MEYQVPQFIEVEDKLIGPLTLRQFIYLAGAGGLCIIFIVYLGLIFGILLALPVSGFAVALAFYKVNGKPFIEVVENGFNYYTGSKLFLWKHGGEAAVEKSAPSTAAAMPAPSSRSSKLTRGKLSELAWSLDIKKNPGSSQS